MKRTKSTRIAGTIIAKGHAVYGCMAWETPYANIKCDDGITRAWWMANDEIQNNLAVGSRIIGFISTKTGNLFRVKTIN